MEIDKKIIKKLVEALDELKKSLKGENLTISDLTVEEEVEVIESNEESRDESAYDWNVVKAAVIILSYMLFSLLTIYIGLSSDPNLSSDFYELDKLLITAMIKTISTAEIQALIEETEDYINEHFNSQKSNIKISGSLYKTLAIDNLCF